MNKINCLNPWDIQSKHIVTPDGISEALYAGECRWAGGEHYVLYEREQSKYQIDGVYCALNAGQSQGGQAHGVCYAIDQQGGKSNCGYAEDIMMTLCSDSHGTPHALCYAIEGNVVDRVSAKNGKGWCEDVSPTLNTQDRHAVCFQLCGDRDNPSVSVSDTAYCIPANPMSDRGQAVCYKK